MSFLYPAALALGVLAAVPILLHLRRRAAARRVPFPAVRWLRRASEARARSLRASDLLLLALRVGLLLALALAAAGPLIGRGGAADHAPTDAAIVLDNSASAARLSGDRPVLEIFVERARETLEAAGPADRFWVFQAVGPPLAAEVDAPTALGALDRAVLTDGAGRLARAVARASAALAPVSGRAREIHLLSDLQASAFEGGGATARPERDVPLLVYLPPPLNEENGAVAGLELSGGTTLPVGTPQTLTADIRWYPAAGERDAPAGDAAAATTDPGAAATEEGAGEVDVRLEVDGRTAGAARAARGGSVTFALPRLPPGSHAGRVEIDPSGLRADDARHFAVRVVPPPAVSRAGGSDGFLALALQTLEEAGRIRPGGPADAPGATAPRLPADAEGARVHVVDGVPARGLSGDAAVPTDAAALVLAPPPDPVDLPAFNEILERVGAPWRLLPDSVAGELALAPPADVPGLSDVRLFRRYLIQGPGAGRDRAGPSPGTGGVLLRAGDGEPWLVRDAARGRTVLLVASPLDPQATDLVASPAMIPFAEALLVRWARAPGAGEDVSAGEAGVPIALPGRADSLRDPRGRVVRVEGGAPFTPLLAGVWELFAGEGPPTHVAVNVPPEESDPRPLAPARLQELFPERAVERAGPEAAAWRDAIYRSRRGASTTPWLLGLALVLFAAESVLRGPARPGGGARSHET